MIDHVPSWGFVGVSWVLGGLVCVLVRALVVRSRVNRVRWSERRRIREQAAARFVRGLVVSGSVR
jgi:hypothetical protein